LATGAQVSLWQRTDVDELTWPAEKVIELVQQTSGEQLLIVLNSTGVTAMPVKY
jgi:hypothetical protein